VQANPKAGSQFTESVNQAIKLSSSELVQGQILGKLQLFFTQMAQVEGISA
jgi:hypothetical protein